MDSPKVYGFLAVSVFLISFLLDSAAACMCAPDHPQTRFCRADVVIRARFMGVTETYVNSIFGTPMPLLQYEIKTTKVYKSPEDMQDIRFLYTSTMENFCGYIHKGPLKEEYIIEGRLNSNRVHISLCSFIQPWNQLSAAQKQGLSSDYMKGCSCNIETCSSMPCEIHSSEQCLWTDQITSKEWNGHQAQQLACLPRTEDSTICTWRSLNTFSDPFASLT
uniref:Metalloproteinase inhibitor 1 n=1 Tax=Salvator merianae TaxID=96440 RepID=A0A8D0BFG9_SALMN